GGCSISCFYFPDVDSQIAQLNFKRTSFWFFPCVLPNLETAATLHVERQNSMSCACFSLGVCKHQFSSCLLFEHPDVHRQMLAVPFPCFRYIFNSIPHQLYPIYFC